MSVLFQEIKAFSELPPALAHLRSSRTESDPTAIATERSEITCLPCSSPKRKSRGPMPLRRSRSDSLITEGVSDTNVEDFNGGDISAWGPNSGAGLSVDVEIVAFPGGKTAAKTVTAQVGCDGIALRLRNLGQGKFSSHS